MGINLQEVINDPINLRDQLKRIKKKERFNEVTKIATYGFPTFQKLPLIHIASEYPESLNCILGLLPKGDKKGAVLFTYDDINLLFQAGKYPRSIPVIRKHCPSIGAKELMAQGAEYSIFTPAIYNKKPIQPLIDWLGKKYIPALMSEKIDDDKPYFHFCLENAEIYSMEVLLSAFPENTLFDVVKIKAEDGTNALFYVDKAPEIVKQILNKMPKLEEEDLFALVTEKNRDGDSVLHLATKQSELFEMILSRLSGDRLFEALRVKNNNGNTILHLAAQKPDLLKIVISLLSQDEAFDKPRIMDALKAKNNSGYTVVQESFSDFRSLKLLLTAFPELKPLDILSITNDTIELMLQRVARQPELVLASIESLPIEERFDFVMQKMQSNNTLLQVLAAKSSRALPNLLRLLPENHRYNAMHNIDSMGSNDYLWQSAKSMALKSFLELLPQDERINAMNFNTQSSTFLQEATRLDDKSFVQTLDEETLMHKLLQQAVSNANSKYSAYHNSGRQDDSVSRGKSGFFSGRRHGSDGLKNADNFFNLVQGQDQLSEVYSLLISKLQDDKTRFHRHSFASYLLDELSVALNTLYTNEGTILPANGENKYDKSAISSFIAVLESKNDELNAKREQALPI